MEGVRDYSQRRFLVVDDENFMAGLIERVLRQLKPAEIYKVPNGETALAFFKDDNLRIDCILSDYKMKPVNGLQLLQAVRTGLNPHIPKHQAFIMLTGHGDADVVKTAIALDVNGYLVKPVSARKMIDTMEQVFAKSIRLKDEAYYRSIDVGASPAPDDAGDRTPVWVILTDEDLTRGRSALKEKVDRMRTDSTMRVESAEVRIKNRRRCDFAQLQEGMLLAEDIEAEEGMILVRRGTPLTNRMIDRLREVAAEAKNRGFVWVGEQG